MRRRMGVPEPRAAGRTRPRGWASKLLDRLQTTSFWPLKLGVSMTGPRPGAAVQARSPDRPVLVSCTWTSTIMVELATPPTKPGSVL